MGHAIFKRWQGLQEGSPAVAEELPTPPDQPPDRGDRMRRYIFDQVRQGVLPDEALAEMQRDPTSLRSLLGYGEAALAAGTLLSGGRGGGERVPFEPKVYVKKSDVRQTSSWGEPYFAHNESGEVMKGEHVDKSQLPDMLYHVTTANDAVNAAGYLRGASDQEGGLGKGTSKAHLGVSTTYDPNDANIIQQELHRGSSIARGDVKDFKDWLTNIAGQDEAASGLEAGKLSDAARNASEWYRMNREWHPDQSDQGLMFDAYGQYLHGRDTRGGAVNPLLMGGWQNYAKIDPNQIRILKIPTRNIPDDALIRKHPIGDFMHEVMVHSDVPIAPEGYAQ